MKIRQGFTLVEIMIVIAIIGIIAVLAIPQYQNYLLRSYVTSALAEINGAKIEYEILLNRSESSDVYTPQNIGLAKSSDYCNFEVAAPSNLGGQARAISCVLKGDSRMIGSRIDLARSADGKWNCVIDGDLPNIAKPSTCE